MISIIHPSRQRSTKALYTALRWLNNSSTEIEYILSLDEDDPQLSWYTEIFFDKKDIKILISENKSAVDAINKAAKISKGDILIVVSDDFECLPNWDKQIINLTYGKTDWIAKTFDGIQDWIITLPLMDRVYYNRFGYIYFPEYLHLFCDTEMTCVADMLGKRLDLKLSFPHNHYSKLGSLKDAISEKVDATHSQGEKLFLERAKHNFDLQGELLPIKNQGYLNWIKMKR